MPMLPSGRHVAILLQPLHDLLSEAANVMNVHKILGIRHKKDLHQFVDVLWLVPSEQASKEQVSNAFRDGSLPSPPGLVPVRSGFRLNQFDDFAAQWSLEDKNSLWDFILVRSDPLLSAALQSTVTTQKLLREEATGTAKLMVAWCDVGVHPAQKGYVVEDGELPVWDTYDMLAALGQLLAFLNLMALENPLLNDRMRLRAVWAVYQRDIPALGDWPGLDQTPRGSAQVARAEKWLNTLDENRRKTLHRQCVHECVVLWDHLGERLQAVFPDCAEIIDLVVVSPDANEVFKK